MNFRDLLVVFEHTPSFRFGPEYGFRSFRNIPLSTGVFISIQASMGHYCEPRLTLPVDQYKSFEMAFSSDSASFLPIDKVTNDKEIIALFADYGDTDNIYAYVDDHVIQRLFDYLQHNRLFV